MTFLTDLRDELEPRVVGYTSSLCCIAIAIATALILSGQGVGNVWAVGLLAVTAAIAERGSVRLTTTTEESISLLPTLFAAVLFGPLAAMVVGASSMLGDLARPPYMKWATYTCSRSILGAATGGAALGLQGLTSNSFAAVALATTGGALVAEGLDMTFAGIAARLRATRPLRDLVRTLAPVVASAVPLYAPVVALLVVAYRELSPLTLPLFLAPALAAQRLFALYQEQRRLTDELFSVNHNLERANLSFAGALITTLDARDRYTAGHSAAVAIYARDIAKRMALGDEDQQLAYVCGLVHDIGKIGLPAGLLEKPGPLTLDERRQMEQHSAIGERILAKVNDYGEIASIVRHHHERVDGNGYPDGLSGENIPLISRVIAVADAYNAMTSDRPYREAMPSRVARLRLAQAVEAQFDTSVVAAFEAILAGASEAYRAGRGPGFSIETDERRDVLGPAAVAIASA